MHDELSDLLAEANTCSEESNEAKIIAYQAHTWLREAITEIREYGQFCFRNDEERINMYKSGSYQNRSQKTKPQETEESSTVLAS